ncbi:hypothetical protein SAMN05519104_1881 [Rhizobiales bacterium GAS188]|nr:hypothetical protein SAMN05519104_1881 [Rhizobiales bacterium GAS188]
MTVEVRLTDLERKVVALEASGGDFARRVGEVEPKLAALDLRAASLEARAGALEAGVTALARPAATPAEPTPGFFDRAMAVGDLIGKIVIPLALVWFTWAIKDSVDAALKERELDVTAGKSMQQALVTLRSKTGLTQEAADASALVLASMGRPSIMLLIREYDAGTTEGSVAASKAFLVLGMTHRSDLCDAFATVLRDKGGRFRIQTHAVAAANLGQAQCREQKELLQTVRQDLAGPASLYAGRFSLEPQPEFVKDLREKVDHALTVLAP